jgi:GT2 family glycosyltransferase
LSARIAPAPLVVAAVLTWNDTEMTRACLRSLFESDYPNLKVVLVDNGSAEACGQRLKQEFPPIDLVELTVNRGFTGGGNTALKRGLDLGADYVQLIGNDVTLARTAITQLVRSLEERPRCAGASPLILDPGGETVQFYWATLDRDLCMHFHHDFGGRLEARDWPARESEFIPFICMMWRASVLLEVGLLDESLSTCWEDYDYIVRLADAGYSILMAADARAEHRSGGTTGRFSPYITYYLVRNRFICLFRHGRPAGILRAAPKIARSFVRQAKLNGWDWARQRAMLRGAFDFFLGVRGIGNPPASRKG